jgi:excisionase family DNA binding protein
MPGRRRFHWRLVKVHRNYTVDEAARMLSVTKVTVRRWIEKGLPAITDRRPFLILGSDLRDYLQARAKPKHRLAPGECYCFGCRQPRPAAEGMADYIPLTPTGGNLNALCPVCGTLMYRRISLRQLAAFGVILEVSIMEASPDIEERLKPCPDDHLK